MSKYRSLSLSQLTATSPKPTKRGWYLVSHDDEGSSWISSDDALAFWTGEKWLRPYGWPALPEGKPAMVVDPATVTVVMPPCTQGYLVQLSREINVRTWRGVILTEPDEI